MVEWKYDGIRAQVVKRAGQVWIWSRGEELVTERFPEIVALAQPLPDGTVLDGEIVVWKDGRVGAVRAAAAAHRPQDADKKVLADAPVSFMAYDLLEWSGDDLRERAAARAARSGSRRRWPRRARRQHARLLADRAPRRLGGVRARCARQSRERGVEGFMLKRRDARYGTGRRKQDDLAAGTWWKWKIEPMSVDCVLIYAQAGHGRRASVYTDYTFAVWNRAPATPAEADAVLEAIAGARRRRDRTRCSWCRSPRRTRA